MTWLLSEDEALKRHLSGIVVSDDKLKTRPVRVWFGQPDVEITEVTYPYITVELIDAREATERAHRGIIELTYTPDGSTPPPEGMGHKVTYPIPYDLTYQVTTHARHPRHDRQIIHQMMQQRLGGRIHTLYIPQDNTERSMFLTGQQKRDRTKDNRRLFSNAYTVVVFSELLPRDIEMLQKVTSIAQTVNITYDV